MAARVGQTVTVRGAEFRVVEIRSIAHLGPRYFGRFVFILENGESERFRAVGKSLAHNSRIIKDGER